MRVRYLVPLVMGLLFLVAFVTTERRWQDCVSDRERACFSYPIYLPYEARQGLDVHWPALIAPTLLGMRPVSLTIDAQKGTHSGWLRYVVTGAFVLGFWYLIGLWCERLRAGRRLTREQRVIRRVIVAGICTLGPLSGISVYLGIRGGWEGPWMTIAGFVTPLLLVGMALVELGILPRCLAHWSVRVAIASAVLGLHVLAESSFRAELADHARACDTSSAAFCLNAAFSVSSTTEDALWLQAPVRLLGEMLSRLSPFRFSFDSDSRAVTSVRLVMVWVYWYTLLALASGAWPSEAKVYREARPLVRGMCSLVFGLACLAWLVGGSAHGAGGKFGLMVGMGIAVYALRRPTANLA